MQSDVGAVALVPIWLLSSPASHGAVRLWATLSGYWVNDPHRPDPSRSELAAILNVSTDTINRFLRELQELGALRLLDKKGTAHRYQLIMARNDRTDAPPWEALLPPAATQHPQPTLELPPPTGGILAPVSASRRQRDTLSLSTVQSTVLRTGYPCFHKFWRQYPRKQRKQAALKKWIRLKIEDDPMLWGSVLRGLSLCREMWTAEGREQRYIPHAVTWLGDRRWEDDYTPVQPTLTKHSTTIVQATERFLDRHSTGES